jgi:hypothetical protein
LGSGDSPGPLVSITEDLQPRFPNAGAFFVGPVKIRELLSLFPLPVLLSDLKPPVNPQLVSSHCGQSAWRRA